MGSEMCIRDRFGTLKDKSLAFLQAMDKNENHSYPGAELGQLLLDSAVALDLSS